MSVLAICPEEREGAGVRNAEHTEYLYVAVTRDMKYGFFSLTFVVTPPQPTPANSL